MSFGKIFLGKDEATYGKEGTGWVDYDPEFECGGPIGTPGRQCPFPIIRVSDEGRHRLLHVTLASYRDPLCPHTLYNMFRKAEKPEDIRVYVLQQNDASTDDDCLRTYCELMRKDGNLSSCPYEDQVWVHEVDYREAQGPMWARSLISKDLEAAHANGTLHTQDFCLSTDSHMDYEPSWDRELQAMFEQADNEYAVLTTYVTSTTELGKFHGEVPHLCMITFTSNVRNHATKCATNLSKPKLTNAMFGAGLSYAKCHAELKVPVDPHSEHIFDGEEFNRAARLFTHGYDMYTPNNVVVLHEYKKAQSNPTTRTWLRNSKHTSSQLTPEQRLLTILDVPGGLTDPHQVLKLKQSKYGLGDRRTLDQLIQFSGFDLRHRRPSLDGHNRCGNIQWVPFQQHPKGVDYIPRYHTTTEQPLDSFSDDPTSIWYNHTNHTINQHMPHLTNDLQQKQHDSNDKQEDPDLPHLKINLEQQHASLKQDIDKQQQQHASTDEQEDPDLPHLKINLEQQHASLKQDIDKQQQQHDSVNDKREKQKVKAQSDSTSSKQKIAQLRQIRQAQIPNNANKNKMFKNSSDNTNDLHLEKNFVNNANKHASLSQKQSIKMKNSSNNNIPTTSTSTFIMIIGLSLLLLIFMKRSKAPKNKKI